MEILDWKKAYLVEWLWNHNLRAIKTWEFRVPKKGEYYLSWANPQAWKALNNLCSPYHIAELYEVEAKEIKITKFINIKKL